MMVINNNLDKWMCGYGTQKSVLVRIQKQKWDGFFMLVIKALAVSINKYSTKKKCSHTNSIG